MNDLLLIEDDFQVSAALRLALEDEGYRVVEAPNGRTGLEEFAKQSIDLVLVDLRLPDMTGFDVCRALRAKSIVPIIIVTAQTDTHDLVVGLEAGADDYVTKPVVPKALAARIRAHLRRVALHESPDGTLGSDAGPEGRPKGKVFGDIEVREADTVVLKKGVILSLTKTEYLLMVEFANHPNQVLSRDQLLERVWGYDWLGDSRLVDAHMRRLRVKIEDEPENPVHLLTVRGLGYRLQSP